MTFQPDPDQIVWRLHLESPPRDVYEIIDSDDGRAGFWSESAVEVDGSIHFEFINGVTYDGRILERVPPSKWAVEYFGSAVEFMLEPDGVGGTEQAGGAGVVGSALQGLGHQRDGLEGSVRIVRPLLDLAGADQHRRTGI